MKDCIAVFITTSNQKEAEKIAHLLVEKRLAACVSIVGGMTSIYHWQGKIEQSEEFLLLVKTRQRLWEALVKEVKHNHSYETPEIIALPVVRGFKPYLDWIDASVRKA